MLPRYGEANHKRGFLHKNGLAMNALKVLQVAGRGVSYILFMNFAFPERKITEILSLLVSSSVYIT